MQRIISKKDSEHHVSFVFTHKGQSFNQRDDWISCSTKELCWCLCFSAWGTPITQWNTVIGVEPNYPGWSSNTIIDAVCLCEVSEQEKWLLRANFCMKRNRKRHGWSSRDILGYHPSLPCDTFMTTGHLIPPSLKVSRGFWMFPYFKFHPSLK